MAITESRDITIEATPEEILDVLYDVEKLPDAKDHSASAALVGFDLHFHTLAKATLTGLYGR